jgi:hypothetical protein
MKKSILLLFISCISIALSQDVPLKPVNYEEIGKQISDSSSASYYPKLMDRYEKGDTSLSLDEYRLLYFGYTFQPNYHPWWRSKQIDKLKLLYAKDSLSFIDCDTIIHYASLSVADFPFDLRQISMLGYVYHLKGKDDIARQWVSRRNGILEAIFSSGDGGSCETGFRVICVDHEYEILKVLQFQSRGQMLTDNSHCDRLKLQDAPGGHKYIYFNIWRTMEVLSKKLKK